MPRVRHIAVRFAIILGTAAVLPLLAYGVWSLLTLQRATRESIVNGNLNVATRAAEEIRRYVFGNAEILKALAADLQGTGLEQWQQNRILKNYVLQFREFRELTLFEESGEVLATSRVGSPRVSISSHLPEIMSGVSMSAIRVDDDLLPTSVFAIHLSRLNRPAGWLIGEFSLEEMWRMVDRIRIGEHGFALVIAPDGTLIAHGDPDKKALVAQARNMGSHPLVVGPPKEGAPAWAVYDDEGREQVAVAAKIVPLSWTVVVEQPTAEAYANATELQQQLTVAILLGLGLMVSSGFLFGRRFIAPIFALRNATQALAKGQMETRVHIDSADEFGALGASFNAMADRLVELQEDVKRQERQAMFGRMAAGLVHDLAHPIQNIGNSTRLLLRDDLDEDSRYMFRQTIERELETLKRFMDDLRNIVKPRPIERFPMDATASVSEIVEAMRAEAERAGLTVVTSYADQPLVIDVDRFALGRVYRNLMTNAIQATRPGGRVTIVTARAGEFVDISVTDTGVGIPPGRVAAIFDDFVTTKRRGLGLGLAISKRIVEQLDGRIIVESEEGQGTSFTLRFPGAGSPAAAAVAAS
ncbi:MAG: HAMP domain-containing protein [Luteitalea sp.]|nr:HAMP domain-containing protein [Luteitalea sp.]